MDFDWDEAWEITKGCIGYTNHTLLPEALESWPVHLFEHVLPRHMQIVYGINAKLIAEAQQAAGLHAGFPRPPSRSSTSTTAGACAWVSWPLSDRTAINGVSALHTSLMKQSVFRDLNTLYPGRINNKTNGITPRRWLLGVNPAAGRSS